MKIAILNALQVVFLWNARELVAAFIVFWEK